MKRYKFTINGKEVEATPTEMLSLIETFKKYNMNVQYSDEGIDNVADLKSLQLFFILMGVQDEHAHPELEHAGIKLPKDNTTPATPQPRKEENHNDSNSSHEWLSDPDSPIEINYYDDNDN